MATCIRWGVSKVELPLADFIGFFSCSLPVGSSMQQIFGSLFPSDVFSQPKHQINSTLSVAQLAVTALEHSLLRIERASMYSMARVRLAVGQQNNTNANSRSAIVDDKTIYSICFQTERV
jgi:hypothetical protein